jgi:hypothetical protein
VAVGLRAHVEKIGARKTVGEKGFREFVWVAFGLEPHVVRLVTMSLSAADVWRLTRARKETRR